MKLFVSALIVTFSILTIGGNALAWHPEGELTKTVNESEVTNNQIIEYTITLKNTAQPAQKQYNDLAFIEITDELPFGIELVSDPSIRTITETVDILEPGESFTKKYQVKVTSETDGANIINKACYTADSVVKDNPKQGCGEASVVVNNPESPIQQPVDPEEGKGGTTPETEPEVPSEPEQPNELPKTGINSLVTIIAATSVLGYTANILRLKKLK